MGEPTIIPTTIDRERATRTIRTILEQTAGDQEEFIDRLIDVHTYLIAEARQLQNWLHERDFRKTLSAPNEEGKMIASKEETEV